MTKEKVMELYEKYQEADYKYHKYMDQFFTHVMNGEVLQEATKGMGPEDTPIIEDLDKEADKARIEFEEAYKAWVASL